MPSPNLSHAIAAICGFRHPLAAHNNHLETMRCEAAHCPRRWSPGRAARTAPGRCMRRARWRIRRRRRADHGDRRLCPRQHAWRARGIAARAACRSRACRHHRAHPLSVPERSLRARDGEGDERGQGARRHPCDFRRPVPARYPRLSRKAARRHRHHAGLPVMAASDRRSRARDDRAPASRPICPWST